jgi:hypothetical protein
MMKKARLLSLSFVVVMATDQVPTEHHAVIELTEG